MYKPKEIHVNEKVFDDSATEYFLNRCIDVPVRIVRNGNNKTIINASKILPSCGPKMIDKIIAGKDIVYLAPAGTAVDKFAMPDDRMLCPHFDRLKLASNGCFFKCDWCYLKLTYRAAFPFITVKTEHDKIKKQLSQRLSETSDPVLFNSGELADSLSMEHLTGAAREFIPWFGNTKNGYLFMLTKSDNVDDILDLDHKGRTIIAWSLNNAYISRKFEIGAPGFYKRLKAAEKVQAAGYQLRIRLDPIVPFKGWEKAYAKTIKQIFSKVSPERITLGTLRFEKGFYDQRNSIFTTGPKLPGVLEQMTPMFEPKMIEGFNRPKGGKYSFSEKKRTEIFSFAINEIRKYSDCKIALCKESTEVWNDTGLDASKCNCVCQLDHADMDRKVDAKALTGFKKIKGQEESIKENQIKDLKIKCAAQLLKEHSVICRRYGVKLTPPIIDISSGKSRLGYWNPGDKILSISWHLIETEIWDIVIETLKHEMAHQYVSEHYNDADSHGKYFKKACKKLGVHPAFVPRSSHPDKINAFKGELSADAQRMLSTVEKILARTQSDNEYEARIASRKANEKLNKYNLQRIEDDNPDIKYLTICHKKKRIESIQRAILNILDDYYYVDSVTSYTYDAQDDTEYKCIVLVGKKEAIKVAEYVYHFLFDAAQTLWQNFRKENNAKRKDKVSFDMGFIKGIEDNHKKILKNSQIKINGDTSLPMKTVKALMEQNQRMIQGEVSRIFPSLSTIRFGSHRTSSGAYKEGFKNGKNTHIKKGVTSQGAGISGLLTE